MTPLAVAALTGVVVALAATAAALITAAVPADLNDVDPTDADLADPDPRTGVIMAAPTRELFDEPDPATRTLSALYAIAAYRSGAGRPARYSAYRTKTDSPCDECFAVQHEHPATAPPRAQAQVRRTITGGTTLRLCRAHAALWRERDADDASGGTRRWNR